MSAEERVEELTEKVRKALQVIDQQKAVIDALQKNLAPELSSAIESNIASARNAYIPKFKGERGEDGMKFMRKFEREAKSLKWSDETMFAKFGSYMEDAAGEWFRVFIENAPQPEKPENWGSLKEMFLSYFLCGNHRNYLIRQITEKVERG